MFNLGDVILRLVLGDTTGFRQQVAREAEGAGDAAGLSMGQRITGALKKGIAGAGIGVLFTSAVEAAGNFEDRLRTINTVANLTDSELAHVGEGIKGLSRETGKSLDDLAGGFYDLVSAGVPADKAMEVLKNSAILATGALGTTGEAVDVVTSALNAFQIDAGQSAHVTNVLAQAVADGKTTMSDLAHGFSRVAPIAHAAGISFDEVAASTAIMTLKGATASQAYTQITGAINALLTPNAAMLDLQKKTGVQFAKVAQEKGLAVALEELRKATEGNNEEFARALGSSEALTFALSVTGENAGAVSEELNKMGHASDNGGVAMSQFAEKMKSPVERAKVLVANIQSFLVTVGGPFVNSVGPAVFALNQLGQAFGLNNIAAKAFGGLIGGLTQRVLPGLKKAIVGAFASAEIGTRLETLGLKAQTAWIKGMTKKDRIVGAFSDMISTATGAITSGLSKVWSKVAGSRVVKASVAAAGAVAGAIYGAAEKTFTAVVDGISGVWRRVAGSRAVGAAAGAAGTIAGTLYGAALKAGDALSGVLSRVWEAIPGSAAVGAAIKAAAGRAAALFTTEILGSFAAAPLLVPLALVLYVVGSIAGDKESANELVYKKLKEQGVIGGKAAGEATAKAQNDAWVSSSAEFANRQGKQAATAVVEKYGDAMIAAGKRVGSDFSAQMLSHFADVNKAGPAMAAAARRLANLAGLNVAQGIRSQRDTVDQAWNDMLDGLKEATSVTGRTAHLLGMLTSKELQKGLHSADPAVRAQARGTKQLILDELAQLKPRAGTLSKESMDFLKKGMKSKDPDIKQAATAIYNTIHTHLPDKSDGTTWGKNIGKGVAAGLTAGIPQVTHAASQMAGAIGGYLRISSPAKEGMLSTYGGPEGWGERIGLFFSKGLAGTLPDIGNMLASALPVPGARVPALAYAGAPGYVERSRAGDVYNIDVKMDAAPPARDPLAVARQLQRFAANNQFRAPRREDLP